MQVAHKSITLCTLGFLTHALVDFLPMNADCLRRLKPEAYLIPLDTEHGNRNVIPNLDAFTGSSC
jgi:hypothetical protein